MAVAFCPRCIARPGDIVWHRQRPNSSTFSSPVVAHVAGRDQILISGAVLVAAYDPDNGDELWSCPGTADSTCGTIVWDDRRVFASGGHPESPRQSALTRDQRHGSLEQQHQKCYEQSMLVHDGYLYAAVRQQRGVSAGTRRRGTNSLARTSPR